MARSYSGFVNYNMKAHLSQYVAVDSDVTITMLYYPESTSNTI